MRKVELSAVTGNICILAKFGGTDLGTCSHSRFGKTPSYSHINTVHVDKAEL